MNFDDALRLLEGRQETRWKLGLTRIAGLLRALGNPQDAIKTVHAAGTNGKGTFCAQTAGVLTACGLKTGLYTSPHLTGPRERIQIDGRMILPEDFARVLARVLAAESEPASYFELLTAAAFEHFRDQGVDAAVIEVGMGGRLDATNVIAKPLLTVITSISLDHTRHLGTTLGAIAAEKAGILKPDVPCLSGEDGPQALAVIREKAYEVSAPLNVVRPQFEHHAIDWNARAQTADFAGLGPLTVGMLGRPALRCAALVLEAVARLREAGLVLPAGSVRRGLRETRLPGRFEIVELDGAPLILDGAHNSAAMRAFVETWTESPWSHADAVFIFGVLADKNYREIVERLAPSARRVIVTQPTSPRALPAEEAAALFRARGCRVDVAPRPSEALALWRRQAPPSGAVAGSFYLVGELHPRLREAAA